MYIINSHTLSILASYSVQQLYINYTYVVRLYMDLNILEHIGQEQLLVEYKTKFTKKSCVRNKMFCNFKLHSNMYIKIHTYITCSFFFDHH